MHQKQKPNMKLKVLVGNGRKIGLLALPFLVSGVILNILYPAFFAVGGPPDPLAVVSVIFLAAGLIVWGWSVYLILTMIPQRKLITTGPYSLNKHPLYNGVALLVIPWVGLLCNTWLGILIGLVVYIGSRLFSPEEEQMLSKIFGKEWDKYSAGVKLPWL